MKKYLVIYVAPIGAMDEMMKNSSPEDRKKGMDEWMEWAKKHKEIVDLGAPLGRNARVTKDSISNIRNEIGGYSFVEAESQEAAAEIFRDSPHFQLPGAYIEIMECVAM